MCTLVRYYMPFLLIILKSPLLKVFLVAMSAVCSKLLRGTVSPAASHFIAWAHSIIGHCRSDTELWQHKCVSVMLAIVFITFHPKQTLSETERWSQIKKLLM